MTKQLKNFINQKLNEIKWLDGRTTDFTEDEVEDIVNDSKVDFDGSIFDRSLDPDSGYYGEFDIWYDYFAETDLAPYLTTLHANPLKKYLLWGTWQVCGEISIEAHSPEEAYQKAIGNIDDIPIPSGEYVDGSFEITSDIDQIKMINKEE